VVGKQDYLTAEAQYKFFRQDRDDMFASTSTSTLGSVGSSIEHGRAFLNYDYDWWTFDATESQYFCWTQRDVSTCSPGPCDDDVQLKAKLPANTWSSASVNDLESNAGDIDDHCTVDFDHDGYMYSAFHTDVSGSDQIKFELELYDPSSGNWSSFAPSAGILPLPGGHTGADFPTLSVAPVWNGSAWVSRIFIVAQSSNDQDDLLWWTCEGDEVDCDQVSEWSYGATDVGGAVTRQPMVASIPVLGHSFVLYELSNGDIAVAEWCDGDSDWSDVGIVPRPSGYSGDLNFGWFAGSPVPTVAWNAVTTLHAVFLGVETGTGGRVNPIHWSAEIGTDLCP
jgi:hypothetical protein